jgi:hypothetical protein
MQMTHTLSAFQSGCHASVAGNEHMQAYRIETTVERDGELALRRLPIKAGERVEVIVLTETRANAKRKTKSAKNVHHLVTPKSDQRTRALDEIRNGLFAKLREPGEPLPSEQFALRKQEEKELEERRFHR